MKKHRFKTPITTNLEGKERARLEIWINLFNLGFFMLVFLLGLIVVLGFIWAKYCK